MCTPSHSCTNCEQAKDRRVTPAATLAFQVRRLAAVATPRPPPPHRFLNGGVPHRSKKAVNRGNGDHAQATRLD